MDRRRLPTVAGLATTIVSAAGPATAIAAAAILVALGTAHISHGAAPGTSKANARPTATDDGATSTVDGVPAATRRITRLPYRIEEPGAYVVETTLVAPPDAAGIVVACDDVTIHLGGNVLIGSRSEKGEQRGAGIVALDGVTNLTVHGGTIRGFAGPGIDAHRTTLVRIRQVRAIGNADAGILVGAEGSVRDTLAAANGDDGIAVGEGSEVVDCTAIGNDADGIDAGRRSLVRDCHARRNCGDGIRVGRECAVVDNVSTTNGSSSRGRECRGAGIGYEGNPTRLGRNVTSDNDSELERR